MKEPEEQGKKSRAKRGSHIDVVSSVGFFISPSETGNHCGGRSTAAGAPGVGRCRCACFVQFHVLSATSLARSFLLRAVCAKTFLFLSFADVSNKQTNSPEVSVGSIACVLVVHFMPFLLTLARGNMCCNF